MACCKICGRKETKKHIMDENKICSECTKKLIQNNYELINVKQKEAILSRKLKVNDNESTSQDESNGGDNNEQNIGCIIAECVMEIHIQNNNMFTILREHIERLRNEIGEKNEIIKSLEDELRNISKSKGTFVEENYKCLKEFNFLL